MTREEAVKLALERRGNFAKEIEKLEKYEKGDTATSFSVKIKSTISRARSFLMSYRLYEKDVIKEKAIKLIKERYKSAVSKWDSEVTVHENAKRLGIAHHTALRMAEIFGLKYSKAWKRSAKRILRENRIIEFKRMGVKDAEIGRFFNVSREYVRQIIILHEARNKEPVQTIS